MRHHDRTPHRYQRDRGGGRPLCRGVPGGAGGHGGGQVRHCGGQRGLSGDIWPGEAGGGPGGQFLLPGPGPVHPGAAAGRRGRRLWPFPGGEGGAGGLWPAGDF